MYGMIHRAAREMALERLSESEWLELLRRHDLRDEHFISAQPYDDAVTMRLLEGLAQRLDLSLDALLESFGRHWIDHAGASPFKTVLSMAGDDLETFLENLDRLHASVKSSMPEASMPSFHFLGDADGEILLLYQSERQGLGMFVLGILRAVLERFGETARIQMLVEPRGVLFRIRDRAPLAEPKAA